MSEKLSQSQLKELRDCFCLFDKDNSGSISAKELRKVCESMGIKVCDRELNSLMTLMDKDGSGCIDFEEFAEVMAEQFFREPSEAELEAAFDYFDQDKSGYICEDELYMAMSHFKSNISRSDIQKMIEVVDRDNDSKINKKEFIYIVLNHKN